jgi:hypothetical protein
MRKQRTQAENPLVTKAKAKAKHLHSQLKERKLAISLGECLNIYSSIEGFKDWNAMKATMDEAYADYQRGSDIVDLAVRVLEDQDAAYRWLSTPNMALGWKKPIEIWGTESGHQQVTDVLHRIEYGVYS